MLNASIMIWKLGYKQYVLFERLEFLQFML